MADEDVYFSSDTDVFFSAIEKDDNAILSGRRLGNAEPNNEFLFQRFEKRRTKKSRYDGHRSHTEEWARITLRFPKNFGKSTKQTNSDGRRYRKLSTAARARRARRAKALHASDPGLFLLQKSLNQVILLGCTQPSLLCVTLHAIVYIYGRTSANKHAFVLQIPHRNLVS